MLNKLLRRKPEQTTRVVEDEYTLLKVLFVRSKCAAMISNMRHKRWQLRINNRSYIWRFGDKGRWVDVGLKATRKRGGRIRITISYQLGPLVSRARRDHFWLADGGREDFEFPMDNWLDMITEIVDVLDSALSTAPRCIRPR